ncbi:NAD(P)H-binding protein [Microvirga sp. HBU67558]|uniref:NAD(P)H-binding protein n=1 Tax=Microvirga TaxID=186650 RepID=UPI001B382050|nr:MULTISPECIES: NAD(P)H-binding protein [unclassified Microvirga]MBQ0822823.1 NAD(P)H-binding protein [Microvirga sp. HBU67558]
MIVVTTPTGSIGRQVLARLLQAGERVRVIARDPSRLPRETLARIELVEGSHGEAEVVDRAFDGADAVFWLPPPNPHAESLDAVYADFARPACEAFRTHGVGHVVGISALGRGTPMADRAGLVTASLAMDDLIAGTGVNYRALTMPSFMDNLLRQVAPISDRGEFFSPVPGDRKAPVCATRDIADAAADLLIDRRWSGQGHRAVLGPEDLSQNDMARIMSEVLGKPVLHRPVPIEAFKAQLSAGGLSPAFVEGYAAMMTAKAEGLDNAEPRTPETTTPTTFRQWCADVLRPAVMGRG